MCSEVLGCSALQICGGNNPGWWLWCPCLLWCHLPLHHRQWSSTRVHVKESWQCAFQCLAWNALFVSSFTSVWRRVTAMSARCGANLDMTIGNDQSLEALHCSWAVRMWCFLYSFQFGWTLLWAFVCDQSDIMGGQNVIWCIEARYNSRALGSNWIRLSSWSLMTFSSVRLHAYKDYIACCQVYMLCHLIPPVHLEVIFGLLEMPSYFWMAYDSQPYVYSPWYPKHCQVSASLGHHNLPKRLLCLGENLCSGQAWQNIVRLIACTLESLVKVFQVYAELNVSCLAVLRQLWRRSILMVW